MSAIASLLGVNPDPHPMRDAFLGWQCRVRQISMRENRGRPDETISPALTLAGETEPMGRMITVMSKLPQHSLTPEFQHMTKRTFDPAQRREKALQLLSETYFQKPKTFSDVLTSVFTEKSERAAAIRRAGSCKLEFDAFGQAFSLQCKVWRLAAKNPYYQSTWWHNHLFNPNLSEKAIILGFEPDWEASVADPAPR